MTNASNTEPLSWPTPAQALTKNETLAALVALSAGVWDDPSLMKFGPLLTDTQANATELKRRWLTQTCGFQIGARDPQLNRNHSGQFMVLECPEDVTAPTDDGANGPWCIVGDDLQPLIQEAFDVFVTEYPDA